MVFVVDDDPSVRDALAVLLSFEGFAVREFADGQSLLDQMSQERPSCILLDVNMPGRSGIEILSAIDVNRSCVPVLMISGQGDIPTAVRAIKSGAFDFFEKPFDAETVVLRIRESIASFAAQAAARQSPDEAQFPGYELLTPRERDVLKEIAGGASNKEAGRTLGISPRTIEVHRARVMEKLGAKNAADLVRIVLSREAQQ